jgi:esterase/lipase superfamily enzyme
MLGIRNLLLVAAGCLSLSACAPNVYNSIDLMPSPAIYADGRLDPFENVSTDNFSRRTQLFYATDRQPAASSDPQASYNNERGLVLRTGVAFVRVDPSIETWEEARRVSLSSERGERYSLSVETTRETGIMPFSATRFVETPPSSAKMEAAGRKFASQINAQLANSKNKDVFIYTHGYNVDFDYATLVSKELQHFLGYQGAFISYNWTATPSRLAYFRDQESALATRRNLRSLVEFLSANTDARRIHLIGYSAGSRLVFDVAYQIALGAAPNARVGKLILIGSDLDRAYFAQAIEDGILETVEDLTLYQSRTDSALALSRLVYGRGRLGESSDRRVVGPRVRASLRGIDNLHIIDVSEAEASDTGNGHWYFRSSPWASSDLFLSLLTERDPGARGLVRAPGEVLWRFPADYEARLDAFGVVAMK